MEQKDRSQNAQKNTNNQNRIWNVSYTAIAIWCWLIAVFLMRLWVYDRIPDTYKAQVFVESILTLAIIDVIVVHAVMYYKQAKETNRQSEIALKQFEITDRPWLKVDAVVSDPLHFFSDNGDLRTGFKFYCRNVGRSVAVNATINAGLVIPTGGYPPQKEVLAEQEFVIKMIEDDFKVLSYTLFPNDDPYVAGFLLMVRGDDVKRGEIGNTGQFVLYVVGCVEYQFVGHERDHRTLFAYEVLLKTGRRLEIGKGVSIENLRLQKAFFGGDRAD